MTVAELIKSLLAECGDKDPATVKVEKSYRDNSTNDEWNGEIQDEVYDVDSYGGCDFPLVVVIK
jgi:hypothetical protein